MPGNYFRACVFALCVLALIPPALPAATNDLSGLLQKGLFEEEANRNLDAAAEAHRAVSAQYDRDRALAATAIFRLGEIYRKQSKTNEAIVQYERIVREFPIRKRWSVKPPESGRHGSAVNSGQRKRFGRHVQKGLRIYHSSG